IADHEHQAGRRAGEDLIAGLYRLLRQHAPSVEQDVAHKVHHVAALLCHGGRHAAHGHPGRCCLEGIAALEPEHFGLGTALQDVLGHVSYPVVGEGSVGPSSVTKLSRTVKKMEVWNMEAMNRPAG